MSQQHGPPRPHKIDHVPAVCRQQVRALGGSYKKGIAMHITASPYRAVYSSGNDVAGTGEQFLRTGCGHVDSFLILTAAETA